MDTQTKKQLWKQIRHARVCLERIQCQNANLAGLLSNTMGMTTNQVEYPTPDTAQVYMCVFGRRPERPSVRYRLKFSEPMVWAGVSHEWGLKPADIVVE